MTEAQVARSNSRRMDISRKGVYLFGVAGPEVAGRRLTLRKQQIVAIPFRKLTLIVRYVDAEQWNETSLAISKSDPAWLTEQANIHEAVLAKLMRTTAVVPVRLCTIFESVEEFEATMDAQYERWRRAVARLRGKHEWRLLVYAGPHASPPRVPYPLAMGAPLGTRAAAADMPERVAGHVARLWKSCGALATAARQIDATPHRHCIFEAVFLLPDGATGKFQEALARWASSARGLGLTYYFDGPRPPFTFAQ